MRHLKKGRKLGTSRSHGQAILASLARAVFENGRVKTTEARAKEVRSLIDKIVTLAKRKDLHARRQVLSILQDKKVVHKVFSEIGPRFEERKAGYSRILKVAPRPGDGAPIVLIELV